MRKIQTTLHFPDWLRKLVEEYNNEKYQGTLSLNNVCILLVIDGLRSRGVPVVVPAEKKRG